MLAQKEYINVLGYVRGLLPVRVQAFKHGGRAWLWLWSKPLAIAARPHMNPPPEFADADYLQVKIVEKVRMQSATLKMAGSPGRARA